MLCKGDKVKFLDEENLILAMKQSGLYSKDDYTNDILKLAGEEDTVSSYLSRGDVRLTTYHDFLNNKWRILESYLIPIEDEITENNSIDSIFGTMNFAN